MPESDSPIFWILLGFVVVDLVLLDIMALSLPLPTAVGFSWRTIVRWRYLPYFTQRLILAVVAVPFVVSLTRTQIDTWYAALIVALVAVLSEAAVLELILRKLGALFQEENPGTTHLPLPLVPLSPILTDWRVRLVLEDSIEAVERLDAQQLRLRDELLPLCDSDELRGALLSIALIAEHAGRAVSGENIRLLVEKWDLEMTGDDLKSAFALEVSRLNKTYVRQLIKRKRRRGQH